MRARALVEFEVSPGDQPPVAVTADARDRRGNLGSLCQVDARLAGDPVVCRGE